MNEATIQLDELKNDQISLQKQMIEKQWELLRSKTVQLESFQAAVKNELQNELKPVKSYWQSSVFIWNGDHS